MDDFYSTVFSQDATYPNDGHGWIQWKGTDVCMSIHCLCGALGHIDSSGCYFYRCYGCGVAYAVGQVVKLIKLTPEQAEYVEETSCGFTRDVDHA